MKIAHLVCSFPPYRGGMGNSALFMAAAVADFNHEVTVITPDYGLKRSQDQELCCEIDKINVIRLKPWLSHGNAAWLPQLTWSLLSYDIVHLHYPFYGATQAVLTAKILKPSLKLIIHYHMDTKASGWKGLIFKVYKKIFFPIIFKTADFITCASLDYVKHSNISKYLKKKPQKFASIPFGVNHNLFNATTKPSTSRKLLFVGGLDSAHYFKGVDVLLQAMAITANKTSNWNLTVIGQGNLKNRYVTLAQELGIAQQVDFVDNADTGLLVKHYRESRCLILPSINRNEAFGLVLLEAMACGRPVIASNLPGVRSVFANNHEGLLVKPGNAQDLSEKILRILSNDKLVDRLGESAHQLTETYYSWAKAGNKINELYHRIKYTPVKL